MGLPYAWFSACYDVCFSYTGWITSSAGNSREYCTEDKVKDCMPFTQEVTTHYFGYSGNSLSLYGQFLQSNKICANRV